MHNNNSGKENSIEIIVNGEVKVITFKKITYWQLVELAFGNINSNPNTIYTVTYIKGHGNQRGSLVDGDEVTVRKGMIFNVTATNKS